MAGSCPYCGEDLADGASRCARCGMDVGGGPPPGADDEAPLLFEDEEDPPLHVVKEAPAPAKKFVECPHCGEPNKPKAHRCKACSKPIRDLITDEERAEQVRYRKKIRMGAAAAVAAIGLVLLVVGLTYETGGSARIEYSRVSFDEVDRQFGPSSKLSGEKRVDTWERGYAGRWVRWEGRLVKVESPLVGAPALLVRHRSGDGEADVRVEIQEEEDLDKPNVEKDARVLYHGRLGAKPPEGRPIPLGNGKIFSARK